MNINRTLRDFALENPGSVRDGFLLVIGHAPGEDSSRWRANDDVPWALFSSRRAAEDLIGRLSKVQLVAGFSGDIDAGDTAYAELVEFHGGRRLDVTMLRRWKITAEDLSAYRKTLPKFGSAV
jgi:hypothetical protein